MYCLLVSFVIIVKQFILKSQGSISLQSIVFCNLLKDNPAPTETHPIFILA